MKLRLNCLGKDIQNYTHVGRALHHDENIPPAGNFGPLKHPHVGAALLHQGPASSQTLTGR